MNLITSIIDWKNYIRNRMLFLLRCAGAKRVFKEYNCHGRSSQISSMISHHDYAERSLLNSIEKYALSIPDDEQLFAAASQSRIPENGDPEEFATILHDNYQWIVQFIGQLKMRDLYLPIRKAGIKSGLSVNWLIQLMTFKEQDLTSQIQLILENNDFSHKLPWASLHYQKPVEKITLK